MNYKGYTRYRQFSLIPRVFQNRYSDKWCSTIKSAVGHYDEYMEATTYIKVAPLSPFPNYKITHPYVYVSNRYFNRNPFDMKFGYIFKHEIEKLVGFEINFISVKMIENYFKLREEFKLPIKWITNINVQITLLWLFASNAFSWILFIFFNDKLTYEKTQRLEEYDYMRKMYKQRNGRR